EPAAQEQAVEVLDAEFHVVPGRRKGSRTGAGTTLLSYHTSGRKADLTSQRPPAAGTPHPPRGTAAGWRPARARPPASRVTRTPSPPPVLSPAPPLCPRGRRACPGRSGSRASGRPQGSPPSPGPAPPRG